MVNGSLAELGGPSDPKPHRPVDAENLTLLTTGRDIAVPAAFSQFTTDPSLRKRLRSATACYLDLGDSLVVVEGGGALIHFLSDQQWVLHWSLFVGPGPSGCVIATSEPLGFMDDGIEHFAFSPGSDDAVICAASFSEFIYRFWVENEIWFALHEGRDLTAEQLGYVAAWTT
jgi:hypothetical protein